MENINSKENGIHGVANSELPTKTTGKVTTTNHDEFNYLKQVQQIMTEGTLRTDRTGTGTISIFGMQSKYSLRNSKPWLENSTLS